MGVPSQDLVWYHALSLTNLSLGLIISSTPSLYSKYLAANKHKPWIEAEYQGIVMENDNTVLLNPPLFALDKDAPLRYAGMWVMGLGGRSQGGETWVISVLDHS